MNYGLGHGYAAEVDALNDRRVLGLECGEEVQHAAAGDVQVSHREPSANTPLAPRALLSSSR